MATTEVPTDHSNATADPPSTTMDELPVQITRDAAQNSETAPNALVHIEPLVDSLVTATQTLSVSDHVPECNVHPSAPAASPSSADPVQQAAGSALSSPPPLVELENVQSHAQSTTTSTSPLTSGADATTAHPLKTPALTPAVKSAASPHSIPLPASRAITPTPSRPVTPAAAVDPLLVYAVKEIVFPYSHLPDPRIRIVCQNANGPCPLLALVNALALRGNLRLPIADSVTYDHLVAELGEYLLTSGNHAELDLAGALHLIPSLTRGLDVNVRFDGIDQFDATGNHELALFRAFHLPLVHGWTVDPQDASAWAVLGPGGRGKSFDAAAVLAASTDDDDPRVRADAEIARAFLASSAAQLTVHGLHALATSLPVGSLAVLFRGNHFHVMYVRRIGELYTLVTDVGYAAHREIVWESLVSTDGDSVFVDGAFEPAKPIHDEPPQAAATPSARPGTPVGIPQTDAEVAVGIAGADGFYAAHADATGAAGYAAVPDPDADKDFALALALQEEENQQARAAAEARAAAAGNAAAATAASHPPPTPPAPRRAPSPDDDQRPLAQLRDHLTRAQLGGAPPSSSNPSKTAPTQRAVVTSAIDKVKKMTKDDNCLIM
ncbi:hypothetical protein, variant [Allomyces macrogynus ATCC 38327]|uniref:MINDY deubiquitinase domain-containing protein n=1 Tax=Allomyces macrogynus (strain ATCC 38327) TaxID=578462 RepID=A0A0L0SF16_ALLM3|nr:hypothetical protein, variant [Allomyces macrogynus ATCC 38327]|eukprot:KNE61024.1 hypothetical protein, variant [Allomyces macrogynus ATCC 38327]